MAAEKYAVKLCACRRCSGNGKTLRAAQGTRLKSNRPVGELLPMKFVAIAVASAVLGALVLFLGGISVIAACIAGAIGFVALVAWLALA